MDKKKVFVFLCSDNAEVYGYTLDESGSNLPNDKNCGDGWVFLKSVEISDNPFSLIGDNAVRILRAIAEKGFYLSTHEIKYPG